MVQGRTTSGSALVDKLEGSDSARERLKAILDTLGGHKTIVEVCRELGICEAMFHKLRDHFLQGAVESLEPKKCGRKPMETEPEEVTLLKEKVVQLEKQLLGANLREELAVLGCSGREEKKQVVPPKLRTTRRKRK